MTKNRLVILFALLSSCLNAQNWQSIPKEQSYIVNPRQFIINPYTNDLWFVNDMLASMIDSDGIKHQFSDELQGNLYVGNDLTFAFTPQHTYFSDNVYGLYSFDDFVKTLIYTHSEIRSLNSKLDTLYIINTNSNGNAGYHKYCNGNVITTNLYVEGIVAKSNFIYADLSVPAQVTGTNFNSFIYLHTDPQYAGGPKYQMKFSRKTDTLFVCGKKGISYAYNYDFLDTIAPSNSVNMPARNVLEIEFDHLDRLWAVFGDASNKAFALARYDNGTWVEKYDASNCPINFATYRGLEIDTLGNIWVVDNYNLHTLITPNSPQWLSTIELSNDIAIEVYPNPSSGIVHISSAQNLDFIAVYDCMGRLVYSEKTATIQSKELNLSNLRSGNYTVEVHSGDFISRERFMLLH